MPLAMLPLAGMDQLSNVGVGAAVIALVLIVLRELKPFLQKNGKPEASAGAQSTDFWLNRNREITEKAITTSLAPFIAAQTAVLAQIQHEQSTLNANVAKLLYIAQDLKDGLK